jgi:hypothetical protein
MLKLTYTQSGLQLERVGASLEVLVAQRVLLALRTGETLHVEPGYAAFLLPDGISGLGQLEFAIKQEPSLEISITSVNDGFVEVSLRGSWIATTVNAHEGVFIAALGDCTEFFLYKLWQKSQVQTAFLA